MMRIVKGGTQNMSFPLGCMAAGLAIRVFGWKDVAALALLHQLYSFDFNHSIRSDVAKA